MTNDNILTNAKNDKKDNITFINMPISSSSDKFCYVNLWSQINDKCSENLHKSFIYQLASQINIRKGNYVSRRLSKNYGMLGITLPSLLATVFSFVMFLLLVVGFACTTYYDILSKYINASFYKDYHNQLGIACFSVAIFLALIFIYKTDIIFSSKNSETNREIDEHELMDIYRTHVCKFHFKHYIVVVEDLDRSDKESVEQFIKELRRYYIPCKRKRSKLVVVNWINDRILKNINRITFIVNIKPEKEIANKEDKDLYSKAFDYVLNLKEINVDNYDVILYKLLEENRELFKKNRIPIFKSNDYIPELEWIIRGKKIGIREIKIRLSSAISTYVNLCSKFNEEYISLEKCIAAAYIITAFEDEYLKIKDIGFDNIIDLYVSNRNMTEEDISKSFEQCCEKVEISKEFAEDIKTLINNGLIATDYRQYFFNFPSDSHLHSDKQNRLINTILYDTDISEDEDFNVLAREVIFADKNVVLDSFIRLERLGKYFPNCIFYSKELFELAFHFNRDKMYTTLGEKLQYDNESISTTAKIVIDVIKRNLIDVQEHVEMICDIIAEKAPARSIVVFRKLLIESFYQDIIKFKKLFFNECPLITKAEVDSLKDNISLIDLINLESSELGIELAQTIHHSILSGFELSNKKILANVSCFYKNLFSVLGTTEKEKLTHYMFEIIIKSKIMDSELEEIILKKNKLEDIIDTYVDAICYIDKYGELSENTLQYISDLKISKNLSESLCNKLKEQGFYKEFIINACSTNIELIDFGNECIMNTIVDINFLDENDTTVSKDLLMLIRRQILKNANIINIDKYQSLFMIPYPIILASEIELILNRVFSLKFIDISQINDENYVYLSKYFCKYLLGLNESYEILSFVCSVKDDKIKRLFFMDLDFDKIQYYRIAAIRKRKIIDAISSSFDFNDVSEQLIFMKQTKCTNGDFEKNIKKAITLNQFEKQKETYAEYIRTAKQVNNEMINTLCSLGTIYEMPYHILEKLFASKKYTYYISSKTLKNGKFIFEKHRLEFLENAYNQIFLSSEDSYTNTKKLMCMNENFISYVVDKRLYVGTPVHTRKQFAYCQQTVHCLEDLFENYENAFIIEYLGKSKGFANKDSAVCFVDKIKENKIVAASDVVYINNHEKLVDSALKGTLTRFHNIAKN